jgi:hypothetical protein
MLLTAHLWQAIRHGKQRRTPSRKEKAEKESSAHDGGKSSRFAMGSITASAAKDLVRRAPGIFTLDCYR